MTKLGLREVKQLAEITNCFLSIYYGQTPFEVKGMQPCTKQAKGKAGCVYVCVVGRRGEGVYCTLYSILLGSVSCLPVAAFSTPSIQFWISFIIQIRDNTRPKPSCKSFFFFSLDLSNCLVFLCSEKIQHFCVIQSLLFL